MSAREMLASQIELLPEPLVEETLLFVQFALRQREEVQWADVLVSREVEQEVLDILDGK